MDEATSEVTTEQAIPSEVGNTGVMHEDATAFGDSQAGSAMVGGAVVVLKSGSAATKAGKKDKEKTKTEKSPLEGYIRDFVRTGLWPYMKFVPNVDYLCEALYEVPEDAADKGRGSVFRDFLTHLRNNKTAVKTWDLNKIPWGQQEMKLLTGYLSAMRNDKQTQVKNGFKGKKLFVLCHLSSACILYF